MTYQPINCDLHDRLLAHATLRRPVQLEWSAEDGNTETITARITDVYTKDKEEFLTIDEEGTAPIRLDRLVSVDGLAFRDPSGDGPPACTV